MLLESDILRLFFTGPYLVSSPLCSVSGVDCPSVDPRQPLCSPLSCPAATAFSLLSSHQLPLLVSCRNCLSRSPATNSLSWAPATNSLLGPATNSPLSCPTTNCLSLVLTSLLSSLNCPPWSPTATASLWVASSTLIRLPVPLPGTARFHVQESFVWFRAKTDSSALAAYPHSATYLPLLPLSFILNKL